MPNSFSQATPQTVSTLVDIMFQCYQWPMDELSLLLIDMPWFITKCKMGVSKISRTQRKAEYKAISNKTWLSANSHWKVKGHQGRNHSSYPIDASQLLRQVKDYTDQNSSSQVRQGEELQDGNLFFPVQTFQLILWWKEKAYTQIYSILSFVESLRLILALLQ